MSVPKKDILIAYIPSRRDLRLLQTKHWYRIPVSSKRVPLIVRDKSLKLIAFYMPRNFKEDAFKVSFYGKVVSVSISKRKILLNDEPLNPKSENKYYKIQIEKLLRLPRPILSLRHRRILFITTTLNKFESSEEINDLFLESPLEEKMWEGFKKNGIKAERQYQETIGNKNYFADFALFCKFRKIDVECDGDRYHMPEENVRMDKKRDNSLESKGWSVLRYTTDDIYYRFDETISQVKDTVNFYGGIEQDGEIDKYSLFPPQNSDLTLFDDIVSEE